MLCPPGCRLELLTPRADAIYLWSEEDARGKNITRELNLMEFPVRAPKARGVLISNKTMTKVVHNRYLTEEEIAALIVANDPETESADDESPEEMENISGEPEKDIPESDTPEKNIKLPIPKEIMTIAAAAREAAKQAFRPQAATPSVVPVETASKETGVEETGVEETVAEETVTEETVTEETVAEETIAEETIAEETVAEETVAEETVAEEAVVGEKWELSGEPDDIPRRKRNKSSSPVIAKKTETVNNDDDLGIIQPEFGF